MIALQTELFPTLGSELQHLFVVFLRVSALVSVMPVMGERWVPLRVKFGAALAFALVIAPALEQKGAFSTLQQFIALTGTEILIGLILGLGLRFFVLALQTAGAIAAQVTSLSQILGGAAAEPAPAISHLLVLAGLALATLLGLHVQAAQFLVHSYILFPTGALPAASELAEWGVAQVLRCFSLAFALAAPFVIASLLYNLALGVINRAMPQLMVAFVGAPAITFGGLFLLFAATPLILAVWHGALVDFFLNPVATSP
ncbi:flagellar biosynthesis protein FliR [Ruegeria marisrubri]|uniref:Flagellar biosynthesis protein FliR n=1 Tax=Ruegeria marisrubri TaxID=1685379 RepID=A0A0X3TSD6_9RHOB|nr:flagellar biosynthetic protein FliR [Ruegeria marisrubri]KUJ77961.1 flagellar biosynthesis protein FliR [Ruegeria marisrubri]